MRMSGYQGGWRLRQRGMPSEAVAVDAVAWFVGMWGVGYLIIAAMQALARGRARVNALLTEFADTGTDYDETLDTGTAIPPHAGDQYPIHMPGRGPTPRFLPGDGRFHVRPPCPNPTKRPCATGPARPQHPSHPGRGCCPACR